MKRRAFLMVIGGTLVAVPAATALPGCGGGGDDDDDDSAGPDAATGPTSFDGTTSSSDPSGHSHTFTVLCTDLEKSTATVAATGSGHSHSLTLDAAQLAALAAGDTVTFDTSEGHPHSWSVKKPSNAC